MSQADSAARPRSAQVTLHALVRAPLALALIVVLAVAAPGYAVAFSDGIARSEAWQLTTAVMVWAGLRLAFLIAAGQARFFELFLWLYVYIFLGLAPTIQIRTGLVADTTAEIDPALDVPTAGVVILGLVTYELARALAIVRESKRTAAVESPAPAPSPEDADAGARDLSSTRLMVLALFSVSVSTYFIYTLGLSTFIGSRQAAAAARSQAWTDQSVREIVLALALFPALVAAGGIAQKLRANRERGQRTALQVGLLLTVVLVLVVANPISAPRYTAGTVLFAVAVYLGAARTAWRIRATMIACVGGFLVVFPVADSFRRDGGTLSRGSTFLGEYVGNSDYDSYWQIANAYSYWRDGLVEPFGQILGSVFFAVPRSVWPGKPTDTGILLADYRGYDFTNLSAPLWAEALVNGGLIGVVVVFAGAGYALRRLDSALEVAMPRAGLWAVVGGLFPVYTTILLRGSLLQATGPMVIAVACVLFLRLSQRTGPEPEPDQDPRYTSSRRRAIALISSRSRT